MIFRLTRRRVQMTLRRKINVGKKKSGCMINHPPTHLPHSKKKMSTFILRRGKKDTPRRSPRANKGQREKRFIEQYPRYNVFSKELQDPGQKKDLAGLTSSSDGDSLLSGGSDDSAYLTEETPESESIPECDECREEECVCSSMSDSDFLSGGQGSCLVCEEDDCVCSSDDDESLPSVGKCSACDEDEEDCECNDSDSDSDY